MAESSDSHYNTQQTKFRTTLYKEITLFIQIAITLKMKLFLNLESFVIRVFLSHALKQKNISSLFDYLYPKTAVV